MRINVFFIKNVKVIATVELKECVTVVGNFNIVVNKLSD